MQTVRRASDQEFWTAVQRLWTFEEPFSRWVRLRKSAGKILPGTLNSESIAPAMLAEELLFCDVYGPREPSSVWLSVFVALAVAGAEIKKFNESAFEFCFARGCQTPSSSSSSFESEAISAVGANKAVIENFLKAFFAQSNFSVAHESYLSHCVWSTPDWSRLREDGPWAGDARVDFIKMLMDSVAATGEFACQFLRGDGVISYDENTVLKAFLHFENTFASELLRLRKHIPASFLPDRLLLVEGATELILLPHFAARIFPDWDERAVLTIPAGGANQVARRYPGLRMLVPLPIDCVLDGDVSIQALAVANSLHPGDRLFVLESGAIEESFSREQIVDLVNAYFDLSGVGSIYSAITEADLTCATNQESLEKLWRKRNRGSFDKLGFAKVVAANITAADQIPEEIRSLITNLNTR